MSQLSYNMLTNKMERNIHILAILGKKFFTRQVFQNQSENKYNTKFKNNSKVHKKVFL